MDTTPELLYSGLGRTVTAFDRFTGRPVWQRKFPGLFAGSISMVLPHGNEVYVGRGSYIYCLDRASGNVLWERGVNGSGSYILLAVAGADTAQQQASTDMAAAMAAQQAASSAAMIAATSAAASSS